MTAGLRLITIVCSKVFFAEHAMTKEDSIVASILRLLSKSAKITYGYHVLFTTQRGHFTKSCCARTL